MHFFLLIFLPFLYILINLLIFVGYSTPFSNEEGKKFNVISFEDDTASAEPAILTEEEQQFIIFKEEFKSKFRQVQLVRVTPQEMFELVENKTLTEEQAVEVWQMFINN